MKPLRHNTRATVAVLSVGVFLTISACGSSSDGAKEGHKLVIGYSNPQGAQSVLSTMEDAFTARAKRYGWEVKGLDAQLDASKQAQDIDQLVAQRVDAIVFMPAGSYETILPSIRRAKAAGIKVVGLSAVLDPDADIAPLDANLDNGGMYLGTEKLAKLVADRTGGRGNAIGVGIGVPVPFLHIMVEQYRKQLARFAPDLTWVKTVENPTDDNAGAEKVVSQALTAGKGKVDAVLAYNDSSAIGASVAFENAGIKDPVIVGQNGDTDAVEAVRDGRITATYDIAPWRNGLMSAALVKGLIEGENVAPWISVPGELYTADNVDQRRDWKEAVSEIESGKLTCANGGCPQEISALS